MTIVLKCVSAREALLAAALVISATGAFAQAPTDAQKSAIRSACRADYEAHCASVPPGGEASLQCLQSHMSSLSSACQSAVRAVEPAAAPKADAAPKTETAPKAETAPAAPKSGAASATPAAKPAPSTSAAKPATEKQAAGKQPTSAEISAVKSACRADYPKVCASVTPGGAAALECLDKNKAKVSASCAKAVTAAIGGASAAAPPAVAAAPAAPATPAAAPAGTAAAAPAAAPTVIVLRPLRPRDELLIVRSACGGDIRTICGGVAPGGGRIAQCLASNAGSLSPACRDVLAPFAAR